jgi:hypothetical protein
MYLVRTASDGAVLRPYVNPYDSAKRRKRYADSHVEARDGRVTWVPASASRDHGWSFPVGSGPGEAAKIVHVYGTIATGAYGTRIFIDKYAVIDSANALLGGFPSWDDRSPTAGAPYPSQNVQAFAKGAGLAFEQRSVGSPEELMSQFPGLYRKARAVQRFRYLFSLMYLILGLFLIASGLISWPGAAPGPFWVAALGMVLLGLLMLSVGILAFPALTDRIRARMKIKHPDRFMPPRT